MARVSSVLVACILAFGGGSTLAQTPQQAGGAPPASAVSPLTVEGAAPPKTIEKQAWTFVQAYSVGSPKLDLIARWREPICVETVNFAPEQAALVKARIAEVAKGVGLPSLGAGCHSNIQIVLTTQPQGFVDAAAKRNELVLGFHYPSDLKKVKTVIYPIQAWYMTATQGAKVGHDGLPFANLKDGMAAQPQSQHDVPNPGNMAGETHDAETVDSPQSGSPPGCAGSLINHCERSVFRNVLVVIDSHDVGGKNLGALADYLALVSLSQAKSLDGCSALPSILDLMAKSTCPGRDPPDGITSADAAFLTALYAANPEAAAASEQTDIAGRMAEILVRATRPVKAESR